MELLEVYIPGRIFWLVGMLIVVLIILFSASQNKESIALAKMSNTNDLYRNRKNPIKILYLRGFPSDGLLADYKSMPLGFESQKFQYLDYESGLANRFHSIGHFIAVSNRWSETIGADRYVFTNEEWQEKVLILMKNASMIVLRPAFSEGLSWEMEQLIKHNHLHKVVICIAPKEHQESYYKAFKNQFKAFLSNLPQFDPKRNYIYFNKQGTPMLSGDIIEVPLYKELESKKMEGGIVDFDVDEMKGLETNLKNAALYQEFEKWDKEFETFFSNSADRVGKKYKMKITLHGIKYELQPDTDQKNNSI